MFIWSIKFVLVYLSTDKFENVFEIKKCVLGKRVPTYYR